MPDLSFTVGGEISLFEKAMLKVVTLSKSSTDQMTSYFTAASRTIDQQLGTNLTGSIQGALGSVGKLQTALGALKIAAGTFVAFEALKLAMDLAGEAADTAGQKLQHLVEIGEKARSLGVSTDFLQAFQADAKLIGLTADQAADALSHAREALTNNIAEGDKGAAFSSTGGDRVHQNVMAGNLPGISDEQLANASTYQAKMGVILDLIDQMEAKGENLAALDLADKIFGPNVANSLRDGIASTDQIRANMEGVTKASDDTLASAENIAAAQRISAEIIDQNNQLAQEYKGWNDEILSIQLEIKQNLVDLEGVYVDIVGKTNEWAARLESVIGQLGGAYGWLTKIEGLTSFQLLTYPGRLVHALGTGDVQPLLPQDGDHPLTIRPLPPLPPSRPQNVGDTSHRLPPLNGAGAGASASPAAKSDDVANYIKSLEKSVAAEKGEADAIGLSNAKKQEAIDLAKAQEAAEQRGSALTEDERKKVLDLADAYAKYKDAISAANLQKEITNSLKDLGLSSDQASVAQRLRSSGLDEGSPQAKALGDQLQRVQELTEAKADSQTFVKGLVGDLIAGKSAAQAFSDELQKIGEKLLDKGIDALISGAFAGSTGGLSLFGLKLAGGGRVGGPGSSTSDSIPAMLSNGEYVVNAAATRANLPLIEAMNSGRVKRLAGGGLVGSMPAMPSVVAAASSNMTLNHAISVDVTGARGNQEIQAMVAQGVSAGLATYDKHLNTTLGGKMINTNRRSSARLF